MKISHKACDYGPGHKDGDHCSICEYYVPDGPHCEKVVDPIRPMDWCNRFEENKAIGELGERLKKRGK